MGITSNIGEGQIRFVAQNAALVAVPIKTIEYESSADPELSLPSDCLQKKNWFRMSQWI